MEAMRAHFEREPDSDWTGYNGSMQRPLMNSRKVLDRIYSAVAKAAKSGEKP